MRAELVPIAGGPPIPITKDITVVGRREYCDVQLDDPSLSKRHCVIIKTDGLLMIRDLASTNGTRVKGQLIRWAALLPNDRIALGKLKFRIFLGPAEIQAPPAIQVASGSKDRATGPGLSQAPVTKSPAPVAVAASVQVAQGGPSTDPNDSKWFDNIAAIDLDDDDIIDLD